MPLGLVRDPMFQGHDPGSYHPESPERLAVLDRVLDAWPRLGETQLMPLRPATEEELLRIHQASHLSRIASCEGRAMALDMDTQTSPGSYKAAMNAVGGLIDLCDAALSGDVDHGMALVRPPGHHATPVRAMGFCLFNNIALAAAHLIQVRGLKRVLIVDWDVHHGNGTEDAFFNEPRVLYFSTHQYPFYPGTGQVGAMGRGAGEGFNINVPIGAGHGDEHYLRVFHDLLMPVARQYNPEFILVSAGYDAHREDPLGGMRLSSMGYAGMTRALVELADECCPGRIVTTLEGGYSPQAQSRAVIATAEALMGDPAGDKARQAAEGASRPRALMEALATCCRYWEVG